MGIAIDLPFDDPIVGARLPKKDSRYRGKDRREELN